MTSPETTITELYKSYTGNLPDKITALAASGSDRQYFRLFSSIGTIIGTYNETIKENEAFIYFSHQFKSNNLPVPEVLFVSDDKRAYLQSDLGDDSLFSILSANGLNDDVVWYYSDVIKQLPAFQLKGTQNLDLSYCYPRKSFDRQSMMWDLNYFKYYFARLSGIPFDEQALEDDFETLVKFLLEADSSFFMFRDFQSRNIMINADKPYFIDYQGGRLGPLQYDVASLLYDAKANLPPNFRNELLETYLINLESLFKTRGGIDAGKHITNGDFNRNAFLKYFDGFVLMRILQALGAYGFRGYYQKKEHFLQSIPYAMKNLKYLFSQPTFTLHLPELKKLLQQRITEDELKQPVKSNLIVRVSSFSFKKGIPEDSSGNGGGFVFDCRALPNPGRLEQYQSQSGLDEPVITYLKAFPEVTNFLEGVYGLVDAAVKNYTERGFKNLMVSFGCTGGRHRSVYCAEKLTVHLKEKFGLNIMPEHHEKLNW